MLRVAVVYSVQSDVVLRCFENILADHISIHSLCFVLKPLESRFVVVLKIPI